MADEATLVIIKPDAIQKGLVGEVVSRLETLRLEMIGAKIVRVSRELAEEHYAQLREKPFFEQLLSYLQGSLHGTNGVLAFVLLGPDAIGRVRALAGATNPEEADAVSIRGSLGRITTKGVMENILHASAESLEAEREIKLWFEPNELLREIYPSRQQAWV